MMNQEKSGAVMGGVEMGGVTEMVGVVIEMVGVEMVGVAIGVMMAGVAGITTEITDTKI